MRVVILPRGDGWNSRTHTVIDTESKLAPAPVAPVAATATLPPAGLNLGFLTILDDRSGVFGGYLITNSWGRPLEFRLSTAVQPNRVQQILYGPTLTEYLHADLIGKALIEKSSVQPGLLIVDTLPALALRQKLGVPTVWIGEPSSDTSGFELHELTHARCRTRLAIPTSLAGELVAIVERLDRIDSAVELSEPFGRIREAVAEARKMGVTNRAA